MVLTGNNPVEVGLGTFDYAVYPEARGAKGYETYLTRNAVAVSELLQDAGYMTAMVGKWHLGGKAAGGQGPHEWGFDRTYAILSGGANHWNSGISLPNLNNPEHVEIAAKGKIPQETFYENGVKVKRPMGVYSDDLWTTKMIGFLEEARKADKPFFAYVAFTTPHAPVQAPDYLIDKYVDYYYQLGYEGLKKARWQSQVKKGIIPSDAPMPSWSSNPLVQSWDDLSEDQKRRKARTMATYAAMMESQDSNIGSLLNYLEETGRRDNTLIIYMSDNGPEGQDTKGALANATIAGWINTVSNPTIESIGGGDNYAFLGTELANASTGGYSWWKWFIGEGGVRVPLIIVPPTNSQMARQGLMTDKFAAIKDIPSTILDYAGVKHPGDNYNGRAITPPSGVSIRPFLEGKSDRVRTDDQWHAFELFGNGYVVSGDFKAMKVRTGMWGDGKWHLYDIRKDPGETTPLEENMPTKLDDLVAIYERYLTERRVVPVQEDWSPWQ